MPLLQACSNESTAYQYSVDVHSSEWIPTDTLVFPIYVAPEPDPEFPMLPKVDYRIGFTLRYRACYPTPTLRLNMMLEYDHYAVNLKLGDERSLPSGGWASLCYDEFDVEGWSVNLPDTGYYELLVWPSDTVSDIVSLTTLLSDTITR